jgi:two-component system nitrate/nitrite response regulator NarL
MNEHDASAGVSAGAVEHPWTVLVEANTLLREGLRSLLDGSPYGIDVSEAQLSSIDADQIPDAAPSLLIVGWGGEQARLVSELKRLRSIKPRMRVVVLVESYSLDEVFAIFDAGADAYLSKSISPEVLLKSVELVMLGESLLPSGVLNLVRDRNEASMRATQSEAPAPDAISHYAPVPALFSGDVEDDSQKRLSSRETVILKCLMTGDTNKLIARKFDIAEATVKVHVKAILRKIQAKNRTQAAIWAASHFPDQRSSSPQR